MACQMGLQAISAEYNDYMTMYFVRLLTSATGGFQAPPGYDLLRKSTLPSPYWL
jgi:hypothetical protein